MGATELASSQAAHERMDAAIAAAIAGEPTFPDGTVFVPADLPRLGDALRCHVDEGVPIALVFADGDVRMLNLPGHRPRPNPPTLLDLLLRRYVAYPFWPRLKRRSRQLTSRS
jgi:hypothetical protein